MKSISLLLLLSLMAVACESAPSNPDDDGGVALQNLEFTVPEHWELVYYSEQEAQFRVPDPAHLDYVNLKLSPSEAPEEADPLEAGASEEISVYVNPCGGAFACYVLERDGEFYDATFTTSSSEEAPADLDGVWAPEVDVDQQELVDFLLTAKADQR